MSGRQSPTYPPGLPLLMAIPHAMAGLDGAIAVVAASAALAVWATGMMTGGVAGIIAAMLLAFAPAFLYQSIQPMSDVPVTAAWMTGFLLLARTPSALASGVACAVAVLIRPNLAPLAIVPFFIAGNRLVFAAPVAVAGVFLGYQQLLWYGSPLQSGYGPAEELFALANVGPNAFRYFNWLIATAPVLLLAPLGFARLRQGSIPGALGVFSILVIAAYLIYGVFELRSGCLDIQQEIRRSKDQKIKRSKSSSSRPPDLLPRHQATRSRVPAAKARRAASAGRSRCTPHSSPRTSTRPRARPSC